MDIVNQYESNQMDVVRAGNIDRNLCVKTLLGNLHPGIKIFYLFYILQMITNI